MKTIFFIFRLFSNPFKVINSMVFHKGGKRDNAIVKTLKLCLWLVLGIITTVTLVVVLAEDKENGIFLGSQQDDYTASVYGVEEEEQQELLPDNPDGTVNGLNLQLIDQISTDGYVKEYLTILREFQQGKLTSNGVGLDIDVVIGSSISETSTYYGTPLPKTYLPWDSSSNSVFWNKSVGGLPSEATTLRLANKNVFNVSYLSYANGPLYTDSISIGAPGTDNSVTPFQINHFDSSGYTKSILNGYGESSSRSIDASYFPDSLSALADRFKSNVSERVPASSELPIEHLISMYSAQHNPGPGALTNDYLDFADRANVDEVKAHSSIFVEDLTKIDEMFGPVLANIGTAGYGRAFVGLALIEYCGWKYFDMYGTPSLLIEFGETFENSTGKSASSVMSGNRADISGYARGNAGGSSFTGMTKTVNGVTVRLDTIALYHMWQYMFGGKYYYAKMLQYAGVNVDPTDPNTYMNTLPEGEWKPGGDSVWMTNEKVDMDKLTEDGEKVLNAGYKYLGIPYIYGGNDPNVGIDCSRFVQLVYQDVYGIEIPRATPGQVPYTTRIENKYQDAIPGDLVFYYADSSMSPVSSQHVAIFMGWDGDQPRIMHASQPGDVVKISTWDGRGTYDYWDIRRVPGFNGS